MKNNWPMKKLGEVANIYGGGTPPTSHSEYFQGNTNWFTPTELPVDNVGTVYVSNRKISEQAEKFTTVSGVGTVLLSSRATIGNVAILSNASGYNQGIKGIEPNQDVVDNWYIAYWLKANKKKLLLKSFGTTFKEISTSAVKDLEITIPSKTQQKKIVERLDAVRKAQELCDQQIQKTEELFESLLVNELSSIDKSQIKKLNDLCAKITDGAHKTPKYINTGIPFLSVRNMINGIVDFTDCKFISKEEHDQLIKRCNPSYEDVLIAKSGTTGVATLVNTEKEFSLFVSVALLKPNRDLIQSRFLVYFLNSQSGKQQMAARTKGGIVKNLHIEEIRELEIPLPSIKEQHQIVEKLESVQNYKKILLDQKALLRELFDSVLDKSMKGELDN